MASEPGLVWDILGTKINTLNMKIKKGQRFRCIKDVVMDSGNVAYRKGYTYISHLHGCITDDYGDERHRWPDDIETWEHFELYAPEGYWADGSPKAKFQIGDLVIPIKSKMHPWQPIPVFRIDDVVLNDDNAFEYKAVLDMEADTGRFGITSFKENELEAYTPKEYDKEDDDFSFQDIADGIADLLTYKNKMYGNSALNPINVFAGKCKVGQRVDDKISRIQNSDELRFNDIADLAGYLFLIIKEKGWTDFEQFKD